MVKFRVWYFIRQHSVTYVMGTSESKLEHEIDKKQVFICCTQNRKDRNETSRKGARTKSNVGEDEPVLLPDSMFTPWTTHNMNK